MHCSVFVDHYGSLAEIGLALGAPTLLTAVFETAAQQQDIALPTLITFSGALLGLKLAANAHDLLQEQCRQKGVDEISGSVFIKREQNFAYTLGLTFALTVNAIMFVQNYAEPELHDEISVSTASPEATPAHPAIK